MEPQLPRIVSDYIDAVIKKMGYRRKVRQDVRQELTDHFTDALRDTTTEEENLAAAKNLIEQFGEPKLLGKLMRRAKKRCRPLWLKFIIRSSQTLGALILLIVLYGTWFLSGKPVITTDYLAKYNEFVKPSEKVDEAQNASLLYNKAAESYVDLYDITDTKKFNIRKKQYSSISKEDEIVIREWVDANQESVEFFIEGSFKPYLWREYNSDTGEVVSMFMPYLSEWRNLNRILLWQAYFEAGDGDFRSAIENLLVSYRTAKHIKSQKTIIEQLVGLACIRLSDQALLYILNDFYISRGDLVYLKEKLSDIGSDVNFVLDFDGEKFIAYDEIQRSIVETPIGDHLYMKRIRYSVYDAMYGEFNTVAGNLKALFTFTDKEESFVKIDLFYDKLNSYSGIPPYKIDDLELILEKKSGNHFLLDNVLSTSFVRCILEGYRTKVDFYASNLILALHIYKAENDVYPELLEMLLCDGYIQEMPVDLFSGEQLVYRRDGDSFMLYSVGVDETDNGGKKLGLKDKLDCTSLWDDIGYDNVFWPVEEN